MVDQELHLNLLGVDRAMARIFNVTVRKEAHFTIVADSEDELDKAMDAAEIDDWGLDWEWDIHDPLSRLKTVNDLDKAQDMPADPNMGVFDGEVLDFSDVRAGIPDIRERIIEEIKALKRKITQDEKQIRLFEP